MKSQYLGLLAVGIFAAPFATNQIARVELVGAPGDLMGIDNVSFYRVNGVPEPGTLALLGLASLGLSRRRKA